MNRGDRSVYLSHLSFFLNPIDTYLAYLKLFVCVLSLPSQSRCKTLIFYNPLPVTIVKVSPLVETGNIGGSSGVAFDVWTRPARAGGFYYFLWQGQYAAIPETAEPEVVVFFDSNIAQVKGNWLVDCLNGGSSDGCRNPEDKPAHARFTGSCIFPWQVAIDGFSCGQRAAIPSPGSY